MFNLGVIKIFGILQQDAISGINKYGKQWTRFRIRCLKTNKNFPCIAKDGDFLEPISKLKKGERVEITGKSMNYFSKNKEGGSFTEEGFFITSFRKLNESEVIDPVIEDEIIIPRVESELTSAEEEEYLKDLIWERDNPYRYCLELPDSFKSIEFKEEEEKYSTPLLNVTRDV